MRTRGRAIIFGTPSLYRGCGAPPWLLCSPPSSSYPQASRRIRAPRGLLSLGSSPRSRQSRSACPPTPPPFPAARLAPAYPPPRTSAGVGGTPLETGGGENGEENPPEPPPPT